TSFRHQLNPELIKGFDIYYISEEDEAKIESLENRRVKTNFLWRLLDDFQNETIYFHVFFMYINYMLKPLDWKSLLFRKKYTYSCIFFKSPYPLKANRGAFNSVVLRREFALCALLFERSCKIDFLLNDEKGVNYYRHLSSKVTFIPDPVNLIPASS